MEEGNLNFHSHINQVVTNVKEVVHSVKSSPMDYLPFQKPKSKNSSTNERHESKKHIKLHFENLNLSTPHVVMHPMFSHLQSKLIKLTSKFSTSIKSSSNKFSQHLTSFRNSFKQKPSTSLNFIKNEKQLPSNYHVTELEDSPYSENTSLSNPPSFVLSSSNSTSNSSLLPSDSVAFTSSPASTSSCPPYPQDSNVEEDSTALHLLTPNTVNLAIGSLQHLSRNERAERIRQQRRRDAWEGIREEEEEAEAEAEAERSTITERSRATERINSESHTSSLSTALVPRLSSHPRKDYGCSPLTSMLFSFKYDNRSREMETSISARGNLWRMDSTVNDIRGRRTNLRGLFGGLGMGSTGSERTGSGRTDSPEPPRFSCQLGPVIINQESILVPVGGSEFHVLWHCYNRKNRKHSTCFSMWSRNKQYKAVGMMNTKPFSLPFLDVQFPNGEFNYVSGNGVKGNIFFRLFDGIIQMHSNQSKDVVLSYDIKSKSQLHLRPHFFFQKRCFAFSLSYPFGWRRNGFKLYPAFEFNITPTMGGLHSGVEGDLKYFPSENVSVDLGYKKSMRRGQEIAFASISLGETNKASINGKKDKLGGISVRLRLETPLADPRRFGLNLELNKSCEF